LHKWLFRRGVAIWLLVAKFLLQWDRTLNPRSLGEGSFLSYE
jgi:hypothetical protein